MQANWSIILNVLLLIGVIFSIIHLIRRRKREATASDEKSLNPSLQRENPPGSEDIIAVRKVSKNNESLGHEQSFSPSLGQKSAGPALRAERTSSVETNIYSKNTHTEDTLMLVILAKENCQFVGYELLQTLLSAGLRFGEGSFFHRHQFANGQGPVLCSLAAATFSGTFDLQNMGGFSVRGLYLFMYRSKKPRIDAERFTIMLETAKQLCEGLDAHLLDGKRRPLTDTLIANIYRTLNENDVEFV